MSTPVNYGRYSNENLLHYLHGEGRKALASPLAAELCSRLVQLMDSTDISIEHVSNCPACDAKLLVQADSRTVTLVGGL